MMPPSSIPGWLIVTYARDEPALGGKPEAIRLRDVSRYWEHQLADGSVVTIVQFSNATQKSYKGGAEQFTAALERNL